MIKKQVRRLARKNRIFAGSGRKRQRFLKAGGIISTAYSVRKPDEAIVEEVQVQVVADTSVQSEKEPDKNQDLGAPEKEMKNGV